jgi:tetratricopeptide (TPR) repeat protein
VSAESPRITELRRRVHADPASIAFAQLAEEFRRLGNFHEAVQYCRRGLARHPGYLSARVTLGRSLLELGILDEAAHEFETVLRTVPDNLAAIRGMAEIHQRRGAMERALEYYKRALALARFDPDLEDTVSRIDREMAVGSQVPEASTEPLTAQSGSKSDPEPLIDFDRLLASLGVPNAAPPAHIEQLMSESPSLPPRVEPALPERPAQAPSDDVLAALESRLRAFEARRGAPPPSSVLTQTEATAIGVREAILEELEGWLEALIAARDDVPVKSLDGSRS